MNEYAGPIYLDCAATTPLEPEVADVVMHFMLEDFGNAGSRTHVFGTSARSAVEQARAEVASLAAAAPDEVVFTSGATESNNLAILGLAEFGRKEGRRHIVSTQIEHKCVLDPLAHLEGQGFEVTLVAPSRDGVVSAASVIKAVREDTLLVSVMSANNETGVLQPIGEIAEGLADHSCYFHTDAAQSFGKVSNGISCKRVDLISVSGHKLYAPKGVGALIARRRRFRRPPLQPLIYGGGQERGLRSGTLPVALIAGLGTAVRLALANGAQRTAANIGRKKAAIEALSACGAIINGAAAESLPTTLNLSFPGLDSEAVILALKAEVAISNGSACTSSNYAPSHVLKAMKLPMDQIEGAVRISWCHLTPTVDWTRVCKTLLQLMR